MSSADCSPPEAPTEPQVLRLGVIPGRGGPVRVFRSVDQAVEHLINHLLTAPECRAWAVMLPDWSSLLDEQPEESGLLPHRTTIVQRLLKGTGGEAQGLYDVWRDALARQYRSAEDLTWVATGPGVLLALGIHAVLMVIDQPDGPAPTLVTAFIPGMGDARETAAARREDRTRSDSPTVSQRRARGRAAAHDRDRDWRRTAEKWTVDQRYYHEVFRPALRFLRTQYRRAQNSPRDRSSRDYHLLYERLPRIGAWDYSCWAQTRDRVLPGRGADA